MPSHRAGDSGSFATGASTSLRAWPWTTGLTVSAVIIGVALRSWQFGAGTSLWVDEAAIARNILDRSFWELFSRPLDYTQIAPPGFIALVELCEHVFGISEWSLRLVPFVAGVASVPLCYLLAARVLSPMGTAVATFLFATAYPLILFTSNLKQYSLDVFAVVGIAVLAESTLRTSLDRMRAAWLAAAGALAAIMSHGSVFVLVPAGAVLVLSARRSAPDRRLRVFVGICWAVTAGSFALWASSQTTAAQRAYYDLFWASFGGFGPDELTKIPSWLWRSLVTEFGGSAGQYAGTLNYGPARLVALLFGVGVVHLLTRATIWQSTLLLGPIGLVVLAAALREYPFRGRVILFLLPSMLILAVRGAEAIGQLLVKRRGEMATLVLVPVAVYSLVKSPLPADQQPMRKVMAYVHSRVQPGDRVWVFYGAGQAFNYYLHRFPMSAVVSTCDRAHPHAQLAQLDQLRGTSRAWIIVSHAGSNRANNERTPLIQYLDTIGKRLDVYPADLSPRTRPETSVALLYQLNDSRRLASASSATFPVATKPGPAWGCFGPMTSDERRMPVAGEAVLEAYRRTATEPE